MFLWRTLTSALPCIVVPQTATLFKYMCVVVSVYTHVSTVGKMRLYVNWIRVLKGDFIFCSCRRESAKKPSNKRPQGFAVAVPSA